MEEKHKFIIRYCEDKKGFLLICEECYQCLFIGNGREIPEDCRGKEYEGNRFSCRTWIKQQ